MSARTRTRSAPWSATMRRPRSARMRWANSAICWPRPCIHPAMLQYLDNAQNAAGHINENYAREIMELHTLGVGSGYSQTGCAGTGAHPDRPRRQSLGQTARRLVAGGFPQRLSQLLPRRRLFEFNPNRHDFGDKIFPGHHHQGPRHRRESPRRSPSCRPSRPPRIMSPPQLAQYFCCDQPPEALVSAMARPGGAPTATSPRCCAPCSPSDRNSPGSLGQKFKDPIHYAVSARARRLWQPGDPQRPAAAQLAEPHGRAALRP